MSGLSPEALAGLGVLNLKDVKAELNFSAAKREPLTVNLDFFEKVSIQSWNFDGVLTKLNALGAKAVPPESVVVLPKAEDRWAEMLNRWGEEPRASETPDWLSPEAPAPVLPEASRERPAEEWSSPWRERDQSQPLQPEEPADPRQAWDALPDYQRNNDLGAWFQQWKEEGQEPEDWQKEALKEFGLWRSDEPPTIEEKEEQEDDVIENNRFKGFQELVQNYNWGRLARDGIHILVPMLTGGLATTILPPEQAHNLIATAFGVGSAGFLGAGVCAIIEKILPRHLRVGRLASSLAVLKVTGSVFAEAGMLMGIGATGGLALHNKEIFNSTMKLLNGDTPAGDGAGGAPVDLGSEAGQGQEYSGGGLSPDERGEVVVQPPAGGGADANPQTSTPDSPMAPVKPGDLEQLPNLPDPVEAARIAAQQAAEAARIVALNQGQTVLEIATTMPQQTVSEAILKIIGDIPHGGEITNVIYRSAGEDVGKLHEGAIRELANSLSELFAKADTAANNFGVPYDQGGLNAVNNTQALGPNSTVANIIRAGNLGDMEAAAKIREEVFMPILQGLVK
jgi:hypothetical protein